MTKPIRFQASTKRTGTLRTIIVCVYPTLKQMYVAAQRFDKIRNYPHEPIQPDYIGLAQKFEWLKVLDDGSELVYPLVGYVRLWQERLGAGIVAHEVTHMANHIYDIDWREKHGATTDNIENEEILCHLVSDLVKKVTIKLLEKIPDVDK